MDGGKGSTDLENEILSQGLCTSCGACVGLCPYIKVVRDKVAVIEPCSIAEGQCYDFCPRTHTDLAALNKEVFGEDRSDFSLGSHLSIEMAQAGDSSIRDRAQYGGVVSALMKYAMDQGEINASVLTIPFNGSLMPRKVVAGESSQVVGCAGSNYVSSATLAELNMVLKGKGSSIGMVGLPCQVLALRKMQASKHETAAKTVGFIVGLFCTWALSYKGITDFLKEKVDLSKVKRMDIPPPPANIMVVDTETGAEEFPLDEIREFIRPACAVCYDMTAEFADVSVGTVEGMEGWNTLIVRTPEAARLVARAREDGAITTQPLDEARLAHLREASLQKKRRAIDEVVKRTGDEKDLLYLRLSEEERKSLKCR